MYGRASGSLGGPIVSGRLGVAAAVPALLDRYRSGIDPFFAAQIARAIVEIGGKEARAALDVLARDPSIIVGRAAGTERTG